MRYSLNKILKNLARLNLLRYVEHMEASGWGSSICIIQTHPQADIPQAGMGLAHSRIHFEI